ncbi:putative peptidyl-prolyl cis-trans isomerase E [Neospora caninum Liverpool]|uniref:Peptidyl-prolyl cis-trans isomerase E, putative n=1 Tax=Neospora caninum (strain Liverpool) TaxID=572307 RepID=F0VJR7_NEOCL|nr:putative peptidyl-prolyl cis-trans isomerase E [Neospora caninum Liverpool]CBZ53978.1 putative peptidyl-prolyl cis-trans isomerase E [Neospora caninum Liverpool]CEL67979.1 TPA: peptidyl-prolyl cis-trans isomerase E, putative [Neospora caninum Liverpool]|eukprot:XP_003884010.1 putative peptidyl-prolyl cis-trans isomerase E [Neospora caninum Liverpool]
MLPLPGQTSLLANTGEERLKRTLYVGGLAEEVEEEVLRAAFLPFGDIKQLEIPKDKTTGLHRGFGFIEFEEEDDAKEAMENMDNAELYGRTLRVNLSRSGGFAPGSRNKAIWSDDFFFRQEMKKKGMDISEDMGDAPEASAPEKQ